MLNTCLFQLQHDEFVSVNYVLREYNEIKEEIKTSVEHSSQMGQLMMGHLANKPGGKYGAGKSLKFLTILKRDINNVELKLR